MIDYKDYNKLVEHFVLDLASAVDYVGDLDVYLHKCETESLPCDIQYLKDKVADLKFELFSMYDNLCGGNDNNVKLNRLK